ncbi:MAG TPA: PqqD family peptide modification chaperone [Candidatus Binataceae bacterium]|nr:PqqD family peptide modification chaperone [Candidatus Binataceae bacterium]
MLAPEAVVVVADDQISCNLDGQAAILNLSSGTYYGLDEVGATVWELIANPRRVEEIRAALMESYDVDAAQCSHDLNVLLCELESHGLIRVSDGPTG